MEEDCAIIAPAEVITKESNSSQRRLLEQFSRSVGKNRGTADFALQIIDSVGPVLLHAFELCASKFQEIKHKQKLISGFHDFPVTFHGRKLEMAVFSVSNQHKSQSSGKNSTVIAWPHRNKRRQSRNS
jgi:hypothetical protein